MRPAGPGQPRVSQAERVAALREMLASGKILKGPCCHDALSARLIERAGFDFAFMSGFCTSAARLGAPDTGLISYYEMVDQARYIVEATRALPVIGDGDTGYGNAVNVRRTVQGYAQAGLAGVLVEDQVAPKSCGHVRGKRVCSREEAVARVRAACDARDEGGADIVVVARTDARQAVSLEEALWRTRAFAEAGADVLFVDALESEEEMRRFCEEGSAGEWAGVPKMANMLEGGKTPILAAPELEEMGFSLVAYPLTVLNVAIDAMEKALASLAQGEIPPQPSFTHMKGAVGFDEYFQLSDHYAVPPEATLPYPYCEQAAAASGAELDADNEDEEPGTTSLDEGYAEGSESGGNDSADAAGVRPEAIDPVVIPADDDDDDRPRARQQYAPNDSTRDLAGRDTGRSSQGSSSFASKLQTVRIRVVGRDGDVKIETTLPVGLLAGVEGFIPQLQGVDLESLIGQMTGKEGPRDRSKPVVDFDVDGSGDRVQVFLQ
ncbi:unnamed protein product [Pedinophyceae sp. YPF-701]|nr:unnamed protein product [Pedinophyceae sp. YPF-701]